MDRVRLGVIGLGNRGMGLVKGLLLKLENAAITAVSDDYGARAEDAAAFIGAETGTAPAVCADYRELLARGDVDAVLIITPWECHIPMAIDAMRAGKPVGMEVCGATSLEQCFDLVRAYEQTRTPFMFLENCCYGRTELAVMNMVRQNVFGEIVHCAGAYSHDIREEIATGDERHHYRLRHYLNRNGENYPSHELGPIAKLLGINNGNRMLSLTATASKAAGMNEYLKSHPAEGLSEHTRFAQGDIVTTVIRCANGQTIALTLDTTLPRYYSRDFTVRGTKGFYEERTNSVFLDGDPHGSWREHWNNFDKFIETYEHPIWRSFQQKGVLGGHGGMDGLVYGAFVDCVMSGAAMPIDAYDAAAWMCITPLSEASILGGSAPQSIPDFTNGMWLTTRSDAGFYSLI